MIGYYTNDREAIARVYHFVASCGPGMEISEDPPPQGRIDAQGKVRGRHPCEDCVQMAQDWLARSEVANTAKRLSRRSHN